jgi:flagellar hook assembly protein FlgD
MGGMVLNEVLVDDIKLMSVSQANSVVEDIDGNNSMSIYPNPVENSANMRFALNQPGYTSIKIYNQLGNEVATISEGYLAAGQHSAKWNARNSLGEKVTPGVYYVQLINKNNVITERIIIK